jgi:hypothetical protein
MFSLKKKKPLLKEEGTIKTVAKSLDANSKTIHAAVQSTKILTTTTFKDLVNITSSSIPIVIKHALLKPTEIIGTNLSYILDYLLVSAVTASTIYFYFK